jgi:aerobic-type carbon monoxide dehydrogenase small subunit (CoxS/CutS family)
MAIEHIKQVREVVIKEKICECSYCHSGDFRAKVKPNERWQYIWEMK